MNQNSSNPLLSWSDRPPFDKFEVNQVVSGIDTMLKVREEAIHTLE